MKRFGWLLASLGAAVTAHNVWWSYRSTAGLFAYRDQTVGLIAAVCWMALGVVLWRRRPGSTPALILLLVPLVPPARMLNEHLIDSWPPLIFLSFYGGWCLPAALLLVHPDGLRNHRTRIIVGYALVPAAFALWAAIAASGDRFVTAPPYVAILNRSGDASHRLLPARLLEIFVVAMTVGAWLIAARRWYRARGLDRRLRGPLVAAGAAWTFGQCALIAGLWLSGYPSAETSPPAFALLMADLPLITLLALAAAVAWVELIRPRLSRTRDGVLHLPMAAEPTHRLVLAQAEVVHVLRDPTAEVLMCGPDGNLLNAQRQAVSDDDRAAGATMTWIERQGGRIGAIRHTASLLAEPERLRLAAVIAASALDNHRLHAITLANVEATRLATARMLAASDHARDAIEAAVIAGPVARLDTAFDRLGVSDTDAISDSHDLLLAALADVRAISHASPPPSLAERGLAGALPELVASRAAEVQLHGLTFDRYEHATEATIFLVVSAAIDATDGSVPSSMHVTLAALSGGITMHIEPLDAPPNVALLDRVSALGGRFVTSGRVWQVEIPSTLATLLGG